MTKRTKSQFQGFLMSGETLISDKRLKLNDENNIFFRNTNRKQ